MPKPTLQHRVVNAKRGVTVEIFAYRKLTKKEITKTLREARKGKSKKLKRGTVLKIFASFY
jgi:hypothetical protein